MAKRPTPLLDRTVTEVLHSAENLGEVTNGLRDVRLRLNERVHLIVVGHSESFASLVRRRPRHGLTAVGERGDVALYSYQRTLGRKHKRRISGEFVIVPVSHQGAAAVSYIVTVDTPDFLRHGLIPLIESLYPQMSRPFLTQ